MLGRFRLREKSLVKCSSVGMLLHIDDHTMLAHSEEELQRTTNVKVDAETTVPWTSMQAGQSANFSTAYPFMMHPSIKLKSFLELPT